MGNKVIVFESPSKLHKWLIKYYLWRGFKICVIEPFHAYHHKEKNKAIFYPRELPEYIWKLLTNGKIQLIEAQHFQPRKMYVQAADRAVRDIEKIFSVYRKEHRYMIEYVCQALHSKKAEEVFIKELCEQVGRAYSVNQMLNNLEHYFAGDPILFYGETSPLDYLYLIRIISQGAGKIHNHDRILFPLINYLAGALHNVQQYAISIARLALQTIGSSLELLGKPTQKKAKKHYKYAIAVLGERQLRNNNRRADVLVDEKVICRNDVVYLPLVRFPAQQNQKLYKLKGAVYYPPMLKRNFTNFPSWVRLLWRSLGGKCLRNVREVNTACLVLAEYFRWQKTMQAISFKHFITHCDFSALHISRYLALKEAGVETWYYIDSMNSGNFKDNAISPSVLHPFWSYLNYDHFVAWDDFIVQYYNSHHASFRENHIVGCLWADNIVAVMPAKNIKQFTIAAFDTTYTRNSFTSYDEGITFAQHLLRLVEELPEINLVIKEKKTSDALYHAGLDPIKSPTLLSLYAKMYEHPRIHKYSNQADASEIMSEADMIISFPFTSTTFEALAANKPAIWHDPEGLYRNTPYGKLGGVTTHSYDELKKMVLEIMRQESGTLKDKFPQGSPLMDPYCDGKAIERFRTLLAGIRRGHEKNEP